MAYLIYTKQRENVYLSIWPQSLQDNYLPLFKALLLEGFILGKRIYKTSPSSSKTKRNENLKTYYYKRW